MHPDTPSATSCARSMPRCLLVLGLAASIATVGTAGAQVLVADPASIASNEQGFATQLAKSVEQYAKQVQQCATQLQQYQQLLSSVGSLSSGLSLAPNQLRPVTDTAALTQGKCSGAASPTDLVGSLMNSMSSLLTQSIIQTQQALCAQIVTVQIDKYNRTVELLDRLRGYASQFQQVEDIASAISTLADTGRVSTQVQKYASALVTDMGDWQAQMQADEAIIATLQNQQAILSHLALKGSNTVLGNVVQAAAFAAAFN